MADSNGYIHGYSRAEQRRLVAQAEVLAPSVFTGLDLPEQGRLLEIGCGVGAELKLIAAQHPALRVSGIDLNPSHLAAARDHLAAEIAHSRADLSLGDANQLPFAEASFDCVITIWMLEHVPAPGPVMAEAHRVLKPGGRLICTEVDNQRFGFTPEQPDIMAWWERFNHYQSDRGGNPFVGALLENQTRDLGFASVHAESLPIIDSAREPQRRRILLDYLRDLLLSGAEQLIDAGYADETERRRMDRQFNAASRIPDLRFYYHGTRMTCVKDTSR